MSILNRFLSKIGVDSYQDLNEEEKATYQEYEEILRGRKLTDEDVKNFLETELAEATDRLTETNLSKEDQVFRKVEIRLIKRIQKFLQMPELEKQIVEKQLEAQLK